MNHVRVLLIFTVTILGTSRTSWSQERKTRDELVRDDLSRIVEDGFWIYNDFPKAQALARQVDKPLLVIIRCIPCEACAQLDAEIVERNPAIQELLNRFVCLRIVHANGLDLSLFQYDYDQSFAAFMMNADRTIYGRYGTRSDETSSEDDVSLKGFAKALEAALAVHAGYPQNQAELQGKQPRTKPPFSVPEEYPSLRDRYGHKLDYEGKLAQSCIHCHQVGESQRLYYRDRGEPISDPLIYPYPHPKILGLIMDPTEAAVVKRVLPGSAAEKAGFQDSDELMSLEGQRLLSIADVQWVLHNTPSAATLTAVVRRDMATVPLQLSLADGWRRQGDLSWRATSWDLRRMTTGGMRLDTATADQRQDHGIPVGQLALRVRHVGQYGEHALAKRAGFLQGDLIVEIDGRSDPLRESDLFARLVNRPIGTEVPVSVLREGRRVTLMLKTQ